jgi:hypothetical protein
MNSPDTKYKFQYYDPIGSFISADSTEEDALLKSLDGSLIDLSQELYKIGLRAAQRLEKAIGVVHLSFLEENAENIDEHTTAYLSEAMLLDNDCFNKHGEYLFLPPLSIANIFDLDLHWTERVEVCTTLVEVSDDPFIAMPDKRKFLLEENQCITALYILDRVIEVFGDLDAIDYRTSLILKAHELTREFGYFSLWSPSRKQYAQKAASKSHRKNRENKAAAIEHYRLHKSEYESARKCAQHISGKIVFADERVIERWLSEYNNRN